MTPPTEPSFGALQLLVVGFESAEQFQGHIDREVRELRGRGLIRVLDARLLSRSDDGDLTEVDLSSTLGEPTAGGGGPAAYLLGLDGAGDADGNGGPAGAGADAITAGFAIEDLRRLTDEIGPGELAIVVLVEHVWAAHLGEAIRASGGRLLAQGMLTPEVMMIVGAELQATADAEAAIELAEAARGAALLEALSTLSHERRHTRAAAAAEVVRILVGAGFIREAEAAEAVDALADAGIFAIDLLQGAAADADALLAKLENEPPPRE
jgi:uncharacterized membrane protein